MTEELYQETKERMEKSISHYQSEVSTIRSGRASTTLLDTITVEFYGTSNPLKNIALISSPDPHLITIQPYDPNALEEIEKAITDSDVDLTPNNDGALIRLSVPPLTQERRQELVKLVHKIIEEGRISIRNIRRDSNDKLKHLEKEQSLSEDVVKIELENIQDLTNEHIDILNKMQENKEKEILA
jgi:ribosome recycling factor|tara:strand:+ start:1404 stop:1958 length:555 start_codon:yes stop_codon:yes gene_type:complete